MQAIVTKYIPATNFKPSRVKASCAAGSLILPYDHGPNEMHRAAASALIKKLGWENHGRWHEGGLPDGTGSVFVCISDARDALSFLEQQ